jgi:hypothetical protein
MTLYLTGASLVLATLLNAFLKDETTPKTDVTSWLVVIIATIAWPVVLPSMIRKQMQRFASAWKAEYLN